MAADWIKMRVDLQTHPKIVRILSATGSDKFRVVGGLHAVWTVFDTHSEDGELRGYTPDLLDHVIGWTGFARAMESVGWLVFDGLETLTLPDFSAHNGQSAKRRAEDQKRKKVCRHSVRPLSADDSDKKRTREEKRREESKDIPASDDAPPSPPKKPKGESCTLTTFLNRCREAGEDAIPAGDPVDAYAERVGLPAEYVTLAWQWFKARYTTGSGKAKRYIDWRATFRNAVREGWPKYWAIDQTGVYYLTTAGKQAQREAQA